MKTNVLIFPAGSENAIDIYDALKYNLHFNLFGASAKPDYAQCLYPASNYYQGDIYINTPNFWENFNGILKRFSIDFIIPTHDTIALYLAENIDAFDAKLVCSPAETAKIARSKKQMMAALSGADFLPRWYRTLDEIKEFPAFLKPDVGEGSKGTFLANDSVAVQKALENDNSLLMLEYLPGAELTVDCFTDRNRQLRYVGPRTRCRITMGISFRSETVPLTQEIQAIANEINGAFVFRGTWFFQVKQDRDGAYKFLEFSTRHAGTMALYRQRGINFPLLSLFDAMDMDVEILDHQFSLCLERRLTNTYCHQLQFGTAFIDLDDTLIIDGKVNSRLMQLIYQMLNQGKRIVLLTKHAFDVYQTLHKHRISNNIFDEIIVIDASQRKTDYMDSMDAILVDNYYRERKQAFYKGIRAFDVDAVECLLCPD